MYHQKPRLIRSLFDLYGQWETHRPFWLALELPYWREEDRHGGRYKKEKLTTKHLFCSVSNLECDVRIPPQVSWKIACSWSVTVADMYSIWILSIKYLFCWSTCLISEYHHIWLNSFTWHVSVSYTLCICWVYMNEKPHMFSQGVLHHLHVLHIFDSVRCETIVQIKEDELKTPALKPHFELNPLFIISKHSQVGQMAYRSRQSLSSPSPGGTEMDLLVMRERPRRGIRNSGYDVSHMQSLPWPLNHWTNM